jgi:FkbM family methyltransferase
LNEQSVVRFVAGLTRAFPPVRGAGRLANWLVDGFIPRNRPGKILIEALGFNLRLDPYESACQRALLFYPNLYDRREFAFLRQVLREGDSFVDVGSHIGIYALVASRLVGHSGNVLAVEAVSETAALLREHVEMNVAANVTVRQTGISDTSEVLLLDRNPSNTGGNRLIGGGGGGGGGGEQIPCVPLYDLLAGEGINRVSAAKLDIEGMEGRVLSRFLEDAPQELWPEHLIVEVNTNKSESPDAISLLMRHGYTEVARTGLNRMLSR